MTRSESVHLPDASWPDRIYNSSAQLEQATNAYAAAQARLDDLLQGATAADIEATQAGVRQAQAELDLHQWGARHESILAAEADDGHGFATAAAGDRFGLDIMQERAQAIGAALHVVSAPGQGTRVTVAWPAPTPARP